MKRVLIISPYFPPSNTPDMQRVRMSLPYFEQYGWEAEVVTVAPVYSDMQKDELLLETVPSNIKVHVVKAFEKKRTARFGFGNIAFRSSPFYKRKVNELLTEKKYDLIYFSTTQFAICVLGAYWKKRFGVPYVIDMQDPWHSDYYRDKPKHQQPPKYWLSYRLNKYLEPIALKKADGLISVSESYIADLKNRYPAIKNIPAATITFGSFEPDLDIAIKNSKRFSGLLRPGLTNLVYIGRGGLDMHSAVQPLFKALKQGLTSNPDLFTQLKLYFIGTSYAPKGKSMPTIMPLARQMGIADHVIEITDRISYFEALATLQQADGLFIPGSDDPKYTASKIYPYLMARKPLLAIFNSHSPALQVLKDYDVPNVYSYDDTDGLDNYISDFLKLLAEKKIEAPVYNAAGVEKYSAQNITKKQCDLFNQVLTGICV
ncbi:glycosyltransferase [Mucilaginibacter sp. UR6-11]|uniref:glycosyltransferase n=1 Tax=Mucilaginibacter sp. UR6-11 TaxID=1435644 RepID=UPI001E32D5D1|nr:glycosyltransferase [Mucilaginibacter sp. UR6-11]MCC8425739.1 glycosyltransferase [Mucilaginibacter sp. UR6-11]